MPRRVVAACHELTRREFLEALGAGMSLTVLGAVAAQPADVAPPPFDVVVGRPTAQSATLNVVAQSRAPWLVEWGSEAVASTRRTEAQQSAAGTPVDVTLSGLAISSRYDYRVRLADGPADSSVIGSFRTPRRAGESFVFTLTTDSHLMVGQPRGAGSAFARAMARIAAERPDFHVTLGDEAITQIKSQEFLARNQDEANAAYLNFRRHFAAITRVAPLFFVVGNHEGEGWIEGKGGHSQEVAQVSRAARLAYVPNPRPDTYGFGGSRDEDYFAVAWGDVLLVAIDPYPYSPTDPDSATAWTLGADQLAWLEEVLKTAPQKWKILLQHQLVGGGKLNKVAYGRGGIACAHIGQQAQIHELMRRYGGQIILKGHDHVFADEVADGIRYTTCGLLADEAGADGPRWRWVANPEFRKMYPKGFDSTPGYLRVAVSPVSVEVKYISADGEARGAYTLQDRRDT